MTDTPSSAKAAPQRFVELESLRAILAWWVVVSHILGFSGFRYDDLAWPLNVLRNGSIAVDGFMIVSGFVITHLVLQKREPYKVFIFRRYFRLAPLFITVSVIALALQMLWNIKSSTSLPENGWIHLAIGFTLLHGLLPSELLPDASAAIITPGWSISLEWQFYMVAPLLVLGVIGRMRHVGIVASLVIAGLVLLELLNRKATSLTYPFASVLIFSIHYFLLGILSYLGFVWLKTMRSSLVDSLPLQILAPFLCFAVTKDYALSIWIVVLMAMLCERGPVSSLLHSRQLAFVGTISYSTYLTHYTVLAVLNVAVDSLDVAHGSLEKLLYLGPSVVIATFLASLVAYHLVERPAIVWSSAVARRMQETRREPAERHAPAIGEGVAASGS